MSSENLPQNPEQPPRKPRVAVVFGGRSSEHGISTVTAGAVLRAIDRTKYDVLPIGITREGRWALTADDPERMAITDRRTPNVEDLAESREGAVVLPVDPSNREVVYSEPGSVPRRWVRLTWSSRCCTAPTARTAPSRASWSCPAFRMWARVCWPRPSARTRST